MSTMTDDTHYCRPTDAHLSFEEWTPGTVSRWIGTCRLCKHAARVEIRQNVRLTWEWFRADKLYFSKRLFQYEALTAHTQYAKHATGSSVLTDCPHGCKDSHGCIQRIVCKRITGIHSESIQCGAKCISATGPNCECQCAGANHGAGHAL